MPDRPLLLFPTPVLADKTPLHSGPHPIHFPPHERQNERLSPRFTQLQLAFTSRRVEVQQNIVGIDPEKVLVMEIIGSIEDFANAVKRIEGLEWMGEFEQNDINPDSDFFDTKDPTKKINGRLYLVLTNQEALREMYSLWHLYKRNPDVKFERNLGRFKILFANLKDIRFWGIEDRFRDTGAIEIWKRELEQDGNRIVRFETELWFRDSEVKRSSSKQEIQGIIQSLGGRVLNECIIPEIAYHSLLAELPASAIQEIVVHPSTRLTECDGIMFFRPIGQMAVGKEPLSGNRTDINLDEIRQIPTPTGDPIIAIFDGLHLAQHILLSNRLIIDDPDDRSSEYLATDCEHGTGMASLIIYGDLNDGIHPISRKVYVRPIFTPDPLDPDREETILENETLAVDLIHRAIRRVVEGDGEDPAIAPSVKIINLSIGDPNRQFYQIISPLARLLDWLSFRYNILIIVSAGNQNWPIETGIMRQEFNSLSQFERENVIIRALFNNSHNRKLLSPAEGINTITVGSSHFDTAPLRQRDSRINPYAANLPSTYSSFGTGYRRSIKPDLLYSGGRLFYDSTNGAQAPVILEGSFSREPPGNKVAAPGSLAGDLNKTIYGVGTSNSAALISHSAGQCYDILTEIFEEQTSDLDYEPFIVPLIKAMIVHGCSWEDIENRVARSLNLTDRRLIKNQVVRWCGYGVPQIEKVKECTENRATLLGYGQLNENKAHIFHLPIPPSLNGRREWRRLTVTLAWISPIVATTQKYRNASLWFDVGSDPFGGSRRDVELNTARRGTVQHEIFEGEKILPFSEGDSLQIKVNCRKDGGKKISGPVKYGLVVSLEVAEGIDIPIYNEIRTRITTPISIRPNGSTSGRGIV